jgi:hypothetical protein
MIYSKSGFMNFKSKMDSVIKANFNQNEKDSLLDKKLQLTELLTNTHETEIHIEVLNDSIWRHTKEKGKMIGDYFMIQKNNGILHYYDKSKFLNYKKHNLFENKKEYEVIENKKKLRKIKGFDCFKLILIRKNKESDLGNTIYEMYVTNEINLPIHSVINLNKLFENIFPMSIKIAQGKLSGITEYYELIKIE